MIRQLFSMLWRKKKSNALLVFQLFISFLAMSLFVALNIEKFSDYFKPYNYDYQDLWGVSINTDGIPKDTATEYLNLAKRKLQAIPGVQLSNGSLIPFWNAGDANKINIDGQKTTIRTFTVDHNYQNVLQISLIKGKWFSKDDYMSPVIPVVVTKDFSDEYFKDQDPINKTFLLSKTEKKVRIIGVTAEYKDQGTYWGIGNGKGCIFQPLAADTVIGEFLLRSRQAGNFIAMEERVRKELTSIKDQRFIIRTNAPVPMLKKMSTKNDLVQLTTALIIFFFLILNIFLGISGVFSYEISKRKPEIGLRVATGAGPRNIVSQFLGETIMLTSFAVIPGILIATQFFASDFFRTIGFYQGLSGILISAGFIYLLMISCCIYPALKASRIHPSEALHEE